MEYLNMDTISPATMEQLRLWDEYGKEAASPLDQATGHCGWWLGN
jgi:hypothetical protein